MPFGIGVDSAPSGGGGAVRIGVKFGTPVVSKSLCIGVGGALVATIAANVEVAEDDEKDLPIKVFKCNLRLAMRQFGTDLPAFCALSTRAPPAESTGALSPNAAVFARSVLRGKYPKRIT